jgi:hypothetical protein
MGIVAIVKLESTTTILTIVARSACFTETMLKNRSGLLTITAMDIERDGHDISPEKELINPLES